MWRNVAVRSLPAVGRRRPLPRIRTSQTPPCIRNNNNHKRFYASAKESSSAPEQQQRRGGGILIGLGWALLGLVTIDQILQYRQEREAEEHRRMLYLMQEEANQENQATWDTSLPTLFQCRIAHMEPSLDGTKMLRHVGVGDVVEILEAEIGPNRAYHLCRNPASDRPGSIGWYPIQYLERVD